jgi:hypothetical protein
MKKELIMNKLKWFLVISVLAIVFACCAPVAYMEKDPAAHLSKYKTYAWVETKSSRDQNGTSPAAFAKLSVRNAVNEQMRKLGWEQVDKNPDVLLSYDVLVERNTQQINDPMYSRPFFRYYYNPYFGRWGTIYYPSRFIGYDWHNVPVKEATLTLNMMDAKTDNKVWQGWTTQQVGSNMLSKSEVRRGVRSIFDELEDEINS